MNKNQQEIMVKLGMFEQQIRQLQQQLQIVEESLTELNSLNSGLDEIKISQNKDMLAPLGRGVFVKTKLISDELTVDVGGKTFVKKSIPETKKIIQEQLKKLEDIKNDLIKNLGKLDTEFTMAIRKAQNQQ